MLNHTVEPLKSLAAGFAESGDQTELATWRIRLIGGGRGKDVKYILRVREVPTELTEVLKR